jgi:hypothetical protein
MYFVVRICGTRSSEQNAPKLSFFLHRFLVLQIFCVVILLFYCISVKNLLNTDSIYIKFVKYNLKEKFYILEYNAV